MKTQPGRPKLVDPEVVTYEDTELTVEVAFTGNGSPKPPSSRRIKTALRPVNTRRLLQQLTAR